MSRTVTGLAEGVWGCGDNSRSVGEGVAWLITWPVDSIASCAAGRK